MDQAPASVCIRVMWVNMWIPIPGDSTIRQHRVFIQVGIVASTFGLVGGLEPWVNNG